MALPPCTRGQRQPAPIGARLIADANAYRLLRDNGCLIYRDKGILSVKGGTFLLGADGPCRPQGAMQVQQGAQEQQL